MLYLRIFKQYFERSDLGYGRNASFYSRKHKINRSRFYSILKGDRPIRQGEENIFADICDLKGRERSKFIISAKLKQVNFFKKFPKSIDEEKLIESILKLWDPENQEV